MAQRATNLRVVPARMTCMIAGAAQPCRNGGNAGRGAAASVTQRLR
jgi:hypothetical protein